jgi:hypothetical protein
MAKSEFNLLEVKMEIPRETGQRKVKQINPERAFTGAARTVIHSVLAEGRLTHVATKKAWTVPCSKTRSFKAPKIV